ncbi:sigma-54-dependent Fis family transcriptional regulator [Fulvivirga sp. RKSG066]|uniref:sigma-54-dependent transcriptional regulator n=1 Tax=Fulvivirga aurantia TaxID=2529383 RepID=UPI0012BC1E22|nr:sigma-54 dependent transcriptional regulator [Fulvivirga aurantia]MTI21402.1 sigma-54-dependent Fis family transcriptional regulator [Fulvivirga aurantia]
MKTKANILIVDDDRDVLETARMFLKQEFSSVDIEEDPNKIAGYFEIKDYDVILLDMNFNKGLNNGEEGFYWLSEILKMDSEAIVILITAYGEVDLAVKAMKMGATDFVLKPWKNQKLLATILSAIKHRESGKEISKLKATQQKLNADNNSIDKIIGEAPAIQRVKDLIKKVAKTDANVLILGENGTGKELVARALHSESNRYDNTFINVDLGAITPTLFESELFGHTKGSFTDAKTDQPGRFEIADKGTLFLDEIGNLSLPLQAKLLTVLQSRSVRRVGSAKDIQVDFRLICATNNDIAQMVADQTFRQDLLYRVNTVEIHLPALRDRLDDIPILVSHFLKIYTGKYQKQGISVAKNVLNQLKNYDWPGNIRELQHAVERAVILTENSEINDVGLLLNSPSAISQKSQATTLDEMERDFIIKTLQDHEGNVTQTAKTLGLTRTALYRRMDKHGIK